VATHRPKEAGSELAAYSLRRQPNDSEMPTETRFTESGPHHGPQRAKDRHGGDDMSSGARVVDLTQVPAVPWAWVDEHVYAAIRGCSVKVLQNERRLNIGCSFRRINGTTIRYKLGEISAFLESQPGGGGAVKPGTEPRTGPGRPRKSST
jgi:hypothetical protein